MRMARVLTAWLVSTSIQGFAASLTTVHPVVARMAFERRTLLRLDDLYRVNTEFRAVMDQYAITFRNTLATYPTPCANDLADSRGRDVRWRVARRLIHLWSFLDRGSALPPWLVLHFCRIQLAVDSGLDEPLAGQLVDVLDNWIADIELRGGSIHFGPYFRNADRMRGLFQFSSALSLTPSGSPWGFSDFYLAKP